MASQWLSGSNSPNPLLYFLAGALVPSLAWVLLQSKAKESNDSGKNDDDGEEDEDTAETTTGGPSSNWGYSDAPYKVSHIVVFLIVSLLNFKSLLQEMNDPLRFHLDWNHTQCQLQILHTQV